MRRMLLGILSIFILWGSTAYPKDKEIVDALPLFMDPDFQFSQVGTICLAPLLNLTGGGTARGTQANAEVARLQQEAQQATAREFKFLGYEAVDCKPVDASINDLKKPTEEWLRRLDFGSTKWIFVPAIEAVSYVKVGNVTDEDQGIVSGALFAKQGDSAKLVWRDRATRFMWYSPMTHLIGRFPARSNKRHVLFSVAEEKFDADCSVVWPALNEVFHKNAKKYGLAFSDDLDMMVLYTVERRYGFYNEDHIVLKQRGTSCVAQYTQAYTANEHRRTDDLSDLAKEVHASISK